MIIDVVTDALSLYSLFLIENLSEEVLTSS